MSKRRKRLDNPNQLNLDFERKIETYQQAREEILEACQNPQSTKDINNADEACIEIAAACKRAIRQSGLSREQVVDGINEYFGWMSPSRRPGVPRGGGTLQPKGEGEKNNGKHLSIHMFNHYLSKPTEYPIPSFYIYAIQHVTGSLAPTQALVEPMDARVISGAEIRQMALGKLDETISEMQRLKRELKCR